MSKQWTSFSHTIDIGDKEVDLDYEVLHDDIEVIDIRNVRQPYRTRDGKIKNRIYPISQLKDCEINQMMDFAFDSLVEDGLIYRESEYESCNKNYIKDNS